MKRITADNWLQPDGDTAGGSEAWRDAFLRIRFDAAVPEEIESMFEAARGAMIYGRFFAPLLTMGVEHCYRLLEAAARSRCLSLGLSVVVVDGHGREHPLSYEHNLRALVAAGAIGLDENERWQQARDLRNWAANPDHQAILSPTHGVTALMHCAELLGKLFGVR